MRLPTEAQKQKLLKKVNGGKPGSAVPVNGGEAVAEAQQGVSDAAMAN